MLYMLSKGNATKLFVYGMTTLLLSSHRNGSTTPPTVAEGPTIKLQEQFECLSGNNYMTIQLKAITP